MTPRTAAFCRLSALRLLLLSSVLAGAVMPVQAAHAASAEAASNDAYRISYQAHFQPAQRQVQARITVTPLAAEHALKQLTITAPRSRFRDFRADSGQVERNGARLTWTVAAGGDTLHYRVRPDSSDDRSAFTADWALLRLDELFPPARSRTLKGSQSQALLQLTGPADWSFETRYGRMQQTDLTVEHPHRRLDRPAGWMLAGRLGVRRDTIAERRISVAAPAGSGYPRVPTLAFLRWTLPTLVAAFPWLDERILIVSGDPDMWRGALSGPGSLYLHPERPLISENGTSTLLHELVHVATRWRAAEGADWIVEGLAEFYALELLRRAGGISEPRFQRALSTLESWSQRNDGGLADPSSGPDTAHAALLFQRLHQELLGAGASLDAVVAAMTTGAPQSVGVDDLRGSVMELLNGPSTVLEDALGPARSGLLADDREGHRQAE